MNDLAESTRSVLEAGKLVRGLIGRDEALPIAIEQLESAINRQEAGARSFGFSPIHSNSPLAPDVTPNEVLLAVEADLDIVAVLLAAGHATGDEVGPPGDPALLDQALAQLEATTSTLEEGGGPGRFGFGEPLAAPPEAASVDRDAAAERLRARFGEVMSTLQRETEGVAAGIATAVREIAPDKLTQALEAIGDAIPVLPKVGRLVGRGLRKLEAVFAALGRLLDVDIVARVKAWTAELWGAIKDGSALRPVLARLFGQAETEALVDDVLQNGEDLARFDTASSALSSLALGFVAAAETLRRYVGLIARVSAALFLAANLFPVLEPFVVPTAALTYLTVLGTALVLGMDYADAGLDHGRVVGIRRVLHGVRAV